MPYLPGGRKNLYVSLKIKNKNHIRLPRYRFLAETVYANDCGGGAGVSIKKSDGRSKKIMKKKK